LTSYWNSSLTWILSPRTAYFESIDAKSKIAVKAGKSELVTPFFAPIFSSWTFVSTLGFKDSSKLIYTSALKTDSG
jgi:hypothetical protein